VDIVLKVADLSLADSALHAPAAGFGETDFYPDFVDTAAVLLVRVAKNHHSQTATSAPPGSASACSST
jgi:prophage maintenance system killer protein